MVLKLIDDNTSITRTGLRVRHTVTIYVVPHRLFNDLLQRVVLAILILYQVFRLVLDFCNNISIMSIQSPNLKCFSCLWQRDFFHLKGSILCLSVLFSNYPSYRDNHCSMSMCSCQVSMYQPPSTCR